MNIKYVENKKMDYSLIESLLKRSENVNLYTNGGPVKRLLELKLEKLLKLPANKKVVCVCNGTSALKCLIFLYEKNIGKSLKWITNSFTFPSVVVNNNNTIIVDIDLNSYSFKPDNESFDGVILTNLFGTKVKDIEFWVDYCEKNGKILISDNASSPLTMHNNVNICAVGDSSFGSLHHTKYLGFGEGGFVVVDEEYVDDINAITNFGFRSNRQYNSLSSNYKMSDIAASFILQHIENYDINKHIELQKLLVNKIRYIGLDVFNYDRDTVLGNIPVLFKNQISVEYFRDKGVEANKYYLPLKEHENSYHLYDRIINLPLNQTLDEFQIDYMLKALKESKK